MPLANQIYWLPLRRAMDIRRCAVQDEVCSHGELIRENGLFLPKDLKPLNPQNLK